ncbi:MAG: nucleotidyltransferase [Candidatus Micrarchaeaceae archaeon]
MGFFRQHSKEQPYSDISASALKSIYDRLTGIFGEYGVVIIGGRAVNIYCFNNKRDTHDIDVVVSENPTKIDNLYEKADKNGFFVEKDGSDIKFIDNKTGAQIDFFYKEEVGGIKTRDILDSAMERPLTKNGTVRVIHPALLVLNKYSAGRNKDWQDIANLIRNLYNNSPEEFINEERDKIERYIDSEQIERFAVELRHVIDRYNQLLEEQRKQLYAATARS